MPIEINTGTPAGEPARSAELITLISGSPWMLDVLTTVGAARLPDAWVGAGVLRDLVWGTRYGQGFDPARVRDIDVAFFDPENLSRARDDRATRALHRLRPKLPWEAKNQSAVHTWYHTKFGGPPVAALRDIADAVGTWPETATAVAVRTDETEHITVCAPHGLDDLLDGIWRRNPARITPEQSRARLQRHEPSAESGDTARSTPPRVSPIGIAVAPPRLSEAPDNVVPRLRWKGLPMTALVPPDLEPRWRDLASLSWLATSQLAKVGTRRPWLSRGLAVAFWPTSTVVLIADRADHRVAAHARHAVVQMQPRVGVRRTWRFWSSAVPATAAAALVAITPFLALIALAVVAALAGLHSVSSVLLLAAPTSLLITALLLLAPIVPLICRLSRAEQKAAHHWAQTHGLLLVEASALAAHPDHRTAATILTRQLLAHADQEGIAVTANPATTTLATQYKRMGFVPVSPRSRLLRRTPGARHSNKQPT